MRDHWIEQSTRNPYVRLLAAVLGIFLLGWAIFGLRGVLTPVLVSFLIAYLLDPVVDRFEARGINRTVAIVILMFGLFLLVGVMILLIGLAVSELADVIKNLPGWLEETVNEWRDTWREMPAVVWVSENTGVDIRDTNAEFLLNSIRQLREQILSFLPRLAGPVRTILTHALSGTVALVAWLANIILVPLFSFYLLRDFDLIIARIKDLIPLPYREEVSKVFRDIDTTIAAFVRGQLMVMLILGLLYGVGLSIFRVKMGFGIGLLAGLLSVIPYMGFFIGICLAMLLSLMGGELMWLNMLGTVVTFGVVQILEGTVITPKIVGDKVGLHPVWVIVALMVGAHVLGVLGMLLAVPVAAVLRIILIRAIDRYKESRLFNQGAERISLGARSVRASKSPPEDAENDEQEEDPRETQGSSEALRDKVIRASQPEDIRESVDAVAQEPPRPSGEGASKMDKAAAQIFAPEKSEKPQQRSDPPLANDSEERSPGSVSIRNSVDAIAQADTGEFEAPVVGKEPDESKRAEPEDPKWAERIGRSGERAPEKEEAHPKQASSKTLPDHPVHPELKKIIEEQRSSAAPPRAESVDEMYKTLTGIPVRKKEPEPDDAS
jgi:predicted PurR-regulated permease PerM